MLDLGHILAIIGILIALWGLPDDRIPRFLRGFSTPASALTGIVVCVALFVAGFLPGSGPPAEESEATASVTEASPAETVTREREFEFGQTNDHCQSARSVTWTVPADAGWRIEANSVEVTVLSRSEKSSYEGETIEPDGSGFSISGRIVNRGNCVRVFGNVVARDARGTLRVRARYRETRIAPVG